jgi:hypothetical protein
MNYSQYGHQMLDTFRTFKVTLCTHVFTKNTVTLALMNHATEMYRGVKVKLRVFLKSAPHGGE